MTFARIALALAACFFSVSVSAQGTTTLNPGTTAPADVVGREPATPVTPVTPAIPKGNHYECYNVKPLEEFAPRSVTLRDQFGNRDVRLIAITRLCTPTLKVHNGQTAKIVDRALHLVCYRISSAQPVNRKVTVTNQFGHAGLVVLDPTELCLPSAKQVQ